VVPVYATSNRNIFSFLLKDVVEHKRFKSVGSQFQAWGAVTKKALSPIFRLVLGTTRSMLLVESNDDHDGMSE